MSATRHFGIGKKELAIFGFGFLMAHENQPWFTAGEFNNAIRPINPHRTVFVQNFTRFTHQFTPIGYVDVKWLDPYQKAGPKKALSVTEQAYEPFMSALLHLTTNTGENLNNLLVLPQAVDFVLEDTDFLERLLKTVVGEVVISAENSPAATAS